LVCVEEIGAHDIARWLGRGFPTPHLLHGDRGVSSGAGKLGRRPEVTQ
jgi:hypothetical protein